MRQINFSDEHAFRKISWECQRALREWSQNQNEVDSSVERVSLSFRGQTSANAVKRQMHDLSHKIQHASHYDLYL